MLRTADVSFAPSELDHSWIPTHRLRGGLHSVAASRLSPDEPRSWVAEILRLHRSKFPCLAKEARHGASHVVGISAFNRSGDMDGDASKRCLAVFMSERVTMRFSCAYGTGYR